METAQFFGITLEVAPDTLVPREETELLARSAVDMLCTNGNGQPRVIDVCCGVGNLAAAIAVNIPDALVWACDLTAPCVRAARRNVERHGIDGRVRVEQGDLFAPLEQLGLKGTIDLIVCNPPYISTGRLARDRAHLLQKEPREAFDGGPWGLYIHQRVISAALSFLKQGGWLLLEFGEGQGRQIRTLYERTRAYANVTLIADVAGKERVALGQARRGQ